MQLALKVKILCARAIANERRPRWAGIIVMAVV